MTRTENWPIGAGDGRRDIRLMFTCAGRRVELIAAFQRAARSLKLVPEIHTADVEQMAAAACIADRSHCVPPIGSDEYIPALLEIARENRIDLLFPLIDIELLKIARAREAFAEAGCCAVVSSPEVVQTCRDKVRTHAFLTEQGIDTPQTWTTAEVLRRRKHTFPYFLKPRTGSASKGNYTLNNAADLKALAPYVPDAIIQEFIPGIEHTLDVYTGYDGVARCVVPRQRIEVRGGEVTKARTVKHAGIIETGRKVVEALGGCRGLITIQLFLAADGRIAVIEINPRFGGGVPLAIEAGADFPRWLLMEWQGRKLRITIDGFRDDLLMLRYHQAFFHADASKTWPELPRHNGS